MSSAASNRIKMLLSGRNRRNNETSGINSHTTARVAQSYSRRRLIERSGRVRQRGEIERAEDLREAHNTVLDLLEVIL